MEVLTLKRKVNLETGKGIYAKVVVVIFQIKEEYKKRQNYYGSIMQSSTIQCLNSQKDLTKAKDGLQPN